MKISEATEKVNAVEALEVELAKGLAPQTESIGARSIAWKAERRWTGAHLGAAAVYSHRAVVELDKTAAWPLAYVRRVVEVAEALERWERNEGEWPLARPAVREQANVLEAKT